MCPALRGQLLSNVLDHIWPGAVRPWGDTDNEATLQKIGPSQNLFCLPLICRTALKLGFENQKNVYEALGEYGLISFQLGSFFQLPSNYINLFI